jgi:GMP synthase PP-ATPase subunit
LHQPIKNPGKRIREIKAQDLNTKQFISEKVNELRTAGILDSIPGVVSVTYNIATKPPSTIEAV